MCRAAIDYPDFAVFDIDDAKLVTMIGKNDNLRTGRNAQFRDSADIARAHVFGFALRFAIEDCDLLEAVSVGDANEALPIGKPFRETMPM